VLLSRLLTTDRIRVPLVSRDKPSVLRELVDLLARASGADAVDLLHAVREREETQSTGFGYGIAIPHGRTPNLERLEVAAGRAAAPIEYGAVDGAPVQLFFLVAGPESAAGDQVRALARIARLVRRDQVREGLLRAADAAEFVRVVSEAEAAQG
jgi:mannitol/fructose-specific phosphotransferase system IIA component (Ntr-type)